MRRVGCGNAAATTRMRRSTRFLRLSWGANFIDCMDRRCRLRRGFPRMLRASIWPLAFAAMNDAGAAAFGAGPHVKSVSDVAATAIVTDHAWPQNLDSVDACEPITLGSPQRTLRSATPENRRGASEGTVTTLRRWATPSQNATA